MMLKRSEKIPSANGYQEKDVDANDGALQACVGTAEFRFAGSLHETVCALGEDIVTELRNHMEMQDQPKKWSHATKP